MLADPRSLVKLGQLYPIVSFIDTEANPGTSAKDKAHDNCQKDQSGHLAVFLISALVIDAAVVRAVTCAFDPAVFVWR